jgi:hypothetical protein
MAVPHHWKVIRSRDVTPTPETDRDYARTFFLVPAEQPDAPPVQTTIEFAERRDRAATEHDAVKHITTLLERPERPPRRRVVHRDDSFDDLTD